MASTIPPNPSNQTIYLLLPKISDADPDFRFMALSDLHTVLNTGKQDILAHDYSTAARTVDLVVKSLDDQNGEVQNQAIKVLGPLVKKLPTQLIAPMMEKLSSLKLKNSVDNSVAYLALRTVIEAFQRPIPGVTPSREALEAYSSISRILIPRFLGRHTALKDSKSASLLSEGVLTADEVPPDALDVVVEVVRCFGTTLNTVETEALQDAVVNLLENKGNSAVKKRAVVALSMLAHYLSPDMLNKFIARASTALGSSDIKPVTRRLYINVLGSMARSIPQRFGHHVHTLAPYILQALGEDELQERLEEVSEGHGDSGLEFDEVREAALVALEAFLASCPTQMRQFTDDSLSACLRYLKFDPNYAQDDDEDMDVDDEEDEDVEFDDEDDEFEQDTGFDDDDDASWKVRRCAAKTLHTIISTRSSGDLLDNGVLYGRAAPALVKRFNEREENVRLEVFSALSLLVRKTGEGIIPDFSLDSQSEYLSLNAPAPSRKRRRQSSAAGASAFALAGTGLASPMAEKIPASGPRADLARLVPSIVKGAAKLLKGKLVPTKQAVVTLFDDVVTVQRGGLADYFDQIMDPILDCIKQSSSSGNTSSLTGTGGTASATVTTLRIAALRLIGDIARNHSSSVLQPYLTKIVSGVTGTVHDRFYKLSGEAIQAAEEVIKAITPPRSKLTAQKYKSELSKLYSVVADRVSSNDADTEVRNKALHALGTLLSRTSTGDGTALLPDSDRRAALNELLKRVNAETTRLAAVRAVDAVAALTTESSPAFDDQWVQSVATELSAQLRKANRSLRGSSVQALKHLVLSPATKSNFSEATVETIVSNLVPVINNNDAQLLGPGFLVLARLVSIKPQLVLTPELITSLCELLWSNVPGTVLDSLLVFVNEVGRTGLGKPLMGSLLQNVGVNGDPAVVGKVIGTLWVASDNSSGVTLDNFMQEIKKNAQDSARASLALAVLGEVGLRLRDKSPVQPQIFLDQFGSSLGKVSIAAAVALGRAGAGNIPVYLPVILKDLRNPGPTQYLLLQSVKEILQQAAASQGSNDEQTNIGEYADLLWEQLLAAADAEDNKAVCAECVGRLVIIDPQTYMVKLQGLLSNKSPVIRAIAVQALRYTLPDDNEAFDMILKTYLVDMLRTMLDDKDMEIRRHAMSTLNSAAHNKPELIHGQLGQLMPYVMKESVIKPELIREVMMGPFKHTVDDGLEVRKAAYETLYALMETAFSRISIIDLYDRIIAGLRDDPDIRGLCNLMVSKLVFIDPDETARRLDAIAEAFRATLSTKLKESAVKQEIEKQEEANKSALRVTLLLGDKLKSTLSAMGSGAHGAHQVWTSYWDWVHKDTNFQSQIKVLRDENKELSGGGSS